jgi:microcompartment protein CcmK/EutM
MRLGLVKGHVVLNTAVPNLKGLRLVVVQPLSAEDLECSNGAASGKSLVAVDQLGAAVGQIVGITEGREAANPFWPEPVPVDAYCTLIVKRIDSESFGTLQMRSEVSR